MGTPFSDAILVEEIITGIKRRCNVVSRVTTRGGLARLPSSRLHPYLFIS